MDCDHPKAASECAGSPGISLDVHDHARYCTWDDPDDNAREGCRVGHRAFGEDGWGWPYRARHRNQVQADGRIAVHSYWQHL